jgi:hypothetical protein
MHQIPRKHTLKRSGVSYLGASFFLEKKCGHATLLMGVKRAIEKFSFCCLKYFKAKYKLYRRVPDPNPGLILIDDFFSFPFSFFFFLFFFLPVSFLFLLNFIFSSKRLGFSTIIISPVSSKVGALCEARIFITSCATLWGL